MVTYLDYHVLNFKEGYTISLNVGDMKNLPLGWITEDRLQEYVQMYLDIDNNDVLVRFAGMDDFMPVPKNWGEVPR